MTNNEAQEVHHLKGDSHEDKSFHIVLIDIKKAAEKRKIECVEVPLADKDLKFVAISYRWGELEETAIDTQLDYVANITSFDLSNFYVLCQAMINEPDLQYIPYVWVDAICVNQSDIVKRKATIYQMTNIYQRASYILAVPDLNLRHLMNSGTRHEEDIRCVREYSHYIYHLIHGDTDQLHLLEEEWLDKINVPKDLRQELAKHTDHFTDGLMDLPLHDSNYDGITKKETLIRHIKDAIRTSAASQHRSEFACLNEYMYALYKDIYPSCINPKEKTTCSHFDNNADINTTTTINNDGDDNDNDDDNAWLLCTMKQIKQDEWKRKMALRTESIRQAIHFLLDIVKDWATRVWVVSEFNIAKNKPGQKMKFWFVQICLYYRDGYPFFEFDFSGNEQDDVCIFQNQSASFHALTAKSEGLYRYFQTTMIHHLRQQTFIEMILKSKACKNEDRFYSVLPISEYKHLMTSKEVVSGWHITNTLSVKLKLLEFMLPKDKLDLLFLADQSPSKCPASPTFATLLHFWPTVDDYRAMELSKTGYNFDLGITGNAIQLNHDNGVYKLILKPAEYFSCKGSAMLYDDFYIDKKPLLEKLGLQYKKKNELHVVLIARYKDSVMRSNLLPGDIRRRRLYLVGSFTKNIWVLTGSIEIEVVESRYSPWVYHSTTDEDAGFDIY